VPQASGDWPGRTHARKVLLLAGCVQPAMSPNINTATARVLDAIGVPDRDRTRGQVLRCGWSFTSRPGRRQGADARHHRCLVAPCAGQEGAAGVEAILMNASGCGVTVKDYGHLLR
jgi:glycolate oxidase iron-sulfur subunit